MNDTETQKLNKEVHELTSIVRTLVIKVDSLYSALENNPKTDEKGAIARIGHNSERLDELEDFTKKLTTQLALIGAIFTVLGSVAGFIISKFLM